MSLIHFRAAGLDLELRGSEDFVLRQLKLLSPTLGPVDLKALNGFSTEVQPANGAAAAAEIVAEEPEHAEAAPQDSVEPTAPAEADPLLELYRSVPALDRDHQAHAALVFAYHLARNEGLESVRLGDLLKCCARAGVDSRNFHRALGVLTRRGFLEEVRRGDSYRISDQGAAAIEERRG